MHSFAILPGHSPGAREPKPQIRAAAEGCPHTGKALTPSHDPDENRGCKSQLEIGHRHAACKPLRVPAKAAAISVRRNS